MNWKSVIIQAAFPIVITLAINWMVELGDTDSTLKSNHDQLAAKVVVLEQEIEELQGKSNNNSTEIQTLRERMLSVEQKVTSLEGLLAKKPSLLKIRQEIVAVKKDIEALTLTKGSSTALLSTIRLQLSGIEAKLSIIEKEVFK